MDGPLEEEEAAAEAVGPPVVEAVATEVEVVVTEAEVVATEVAAEAEEDS